MKILSLNCFGIPISFNRKIRFNQIAIELVKSKADIILLQEAIFSTDRKILQQTLTRTDYIVYPNINKNFKNGGLMAFVRGVKVEKFSFHKFKDQGPNSLLTLPDKILGKGFQHLTISYGGKLFDLIHVHMVCLYRNTKADQKSYSNQLNEFYKYVKSNCRNSLIVAGDINVRPDSKEISHLKTTLRLHDTLPLSSVSIDPANLNRGKLMNIFNDEKPFRTDYILIGNTRKVLNSSIIFNLPFEVNGKKYHLSDHFAVLTELLR